MKKLLILTAAALSAAVLMGSALSGGSGPGGADEPEYTEAAQYYLMTEDEGRVAVFKGNELYLMTDTPVSTLPKADRVRLSRGIVLNSEKELRSLLEDYCS